MKEKNFFSNVLWSREKILANLNKEQVLSAIPFFRTAMFELYNSSSFGSALEIKIKEYEVAYNEILGLALNDPAEFDRLKQEALLMSNPENFKNYLKNEKKRIEKEIVLKRNLLVQQQTGKENTENEFNLLEVGPHEVILRLEDPEDSSKSVNRSLKIFSKNHFEYNDNNNYKKSNRIIVGVLTCDDRLVAEIKRSMIPDSDSKQIELGRIEGSNQPLESGRVISEEIVYRSAQNFSLNLKRGGLMISFEPNNHNCIKDLVHSTKKVGGVFYIEGEILECSK